MKRLRFGQQLQCEELLESLLGPAGVILEGIIGDQAALVVSNLEDGDLLLPPLRTPQDAARRIVERTNPRSASTITLVAVAIGRSMRQVEHRVGEHRLAGRLERLCP